MDVRVVGKNTLELMLKPEEHYLTEHGALKLIESVQYALIRMKNLRAALKVTEKQGVLTFNSL